MVACSVFYFEFHTSRLAQDSTAMEASLFLNCIRTPIAHTIPAPPEQHSAACVFRKWALIPVIAARPERFMPKLAKQRTPSRTKGGA